jgi:hypothetical protein
MAGTHETQGGVGRLAALLLVLALCLLSGCRSSEWKELRSHEGGFRVELPGEPALAKQKASTTSGTIELVTYTLHRANGTAYIVAYNDYPDDLVAKSTPDAILDRVVGGAFGERGKLRSSGPIELDSHKGRLVEGNVQGGLDYRSRFYLVRSRLYQVSVVSEAAAKPEDEKRFFESFALLQK